MSTHVNAGVLARAVLAVSQALVEHRGSRADLEQRYVFTLEAALTHGLRERVLDLMLGRTRLFDVFCAVMQAFPRLERDDAAPVLADARYYGNTSLGRARILLRLLLNQGVLSAWLSSLCYNIAVLERYYAPWALLRTQAAATTLCSAVDAAARAVRFELAFNDALLNEVDYWDAHPRIVALDVPLRARTATGTAASGTAEAFTGKRLPLAGDGPHLAACQALLRTPRAAATLRAHVHAAALAQALLRTRTATQERAAALAQALRRAHTAAQEHAAAETQALLRTRIAAQEHAARTHAAAQTRALVAARLAVGVCAAVARVCDVQALLAAARPRPLQRAKHPKHRPRERRQITQCRYCRCRCCCC